MLVARAVHGSRSHDHPFAIEAANDLLAGALRLMIQRLAALAAERGDIDDLANTGALRFRDDVARSLDVHTLKGHVRWRLVDDCDEMDDHVAARGGARDRRR